MNRVQLIVGKEAANQKNYSKKPSFIMKTANMKYFHLKKHLNQFSFKLNVKHAKNK